MMGRWVVPADAVAAYRSKGAGRPMAERSAWSVDYGLRRVNGERLPNAIVWAVSDLDVVPRDPIDKHAAAEVVAAIDLLDDGDPRAVGIAHGIIERALGHQ